MLFLLVPVYNFSVLFCNALFKAIFNCALQGSFSHIRRLFVLIEEAGLKPNIASYSAALECIGRMPECQTWIIKR